MKHLFGLLLTALVATAASSTWAMLAAPHQLTDPAFVVLALGFAVGFVGLWYNRPR